MTADSVAAGATTEKVDVLIVGAGPVGLMLANLLGLYGTRTLLLESRSELIDYPRAVGLDDESFRLIQTIGLGEEIAPLTVPSHMMRLVDAKGRVILYNDPKIERFGWSRKNGFNQPLLDAELARGLTRFEHVDLRFGWEVVDTEESATGITAIARRSSEAGGSEEIRIEAQYLVGCEGGKSPTRKRMGVDFDGLSPSTRWLVVDVANDPLGTPNVWLGADPKRAYVSIGLPQAVRRWEFRLADDEPDDVVTSAGWVQEALRDHVPDSTSLDIIRWRVYTHHGRVASDFRRGRQLIAGDAAHLMPVWLGQGWNSGVRDAMNLAWKLASVTSGQSEDELLDSYTLERKGHASAMVKLSMRMGDVIKMTNPLAVTARNLAGRVINAIPRARDYFGELKFRPLPSYDAGVVVDQLSMTPGTVERTLKSPLIPVIQAVDKKSPVGTQFPQPRVTTREGDSVLLDQATGPWWTVLFWENDPRALLDESSLEIARRLGARLVTVVPEIQRPWVAKNYPDDVVVLGDIDGHIKKWFDTKPIGVVVLRPDRFIAAAGFAQQAPQILAAVAQATHLTTTPSTKES